jgi:hypothetical protein
MHRLSNSKINLNVKTLSSFCSEVILLFLQYDQRINRFKLISIPCVINQLICIVNDF